MNSKIKKNLEDTQKLHDELRWRLTFEKVDLTDRFESLDNSYLELKSKLEEVGDIAENSVVKLKVIF